MTELIRREKEKIEEEFDSYIGNVGHIWGNVEYMWGNIQKVFTSKETHGTGKT